MEQQIAILNWLQNNPEILNSWYGTDITSEDVVKKYKEKNTEYRYYLIGDDAVNIYNDGREDENGQDLTGIEAVISADEEGRSGYQKYVEERGVTTIHEFTEATGGEDHIIISKEEYDQL